MSEQVTVDIKNKESNNPSAKDKPASDEPDASATPVKAGDNEDATANTAGGYGTLLCILYM